MGLATEMYYSSCEVLVDTQSHGVLDVSDDVTNVSVSRREDAVSTCTVDLSNQSGLTGGKYTGVIHIGDRVHVAYIKGGRRIDQFTGRVSSTPVLSFQDSSFQFTAQDCIGDLSYIYWDPFSARAYERYMTGFYDDALDAGGSGYTDSAAGERLLTFLTEVCGFPKNAVKVAKFPDLPQILDNLISICAASPSVGADKATADLYSMLFGEATTFTSDIDGSEAASGASGDDLKASGASDLTEAQQAAVYLIGNALDSVQAGTAEYLDSQVRFTVRSKSSPKGADKPWSQYDVARHTGLFGLTEAQMRQYAGVSKQAREAGRVEQFRALAGVLRALSGTMDKPTAMSLAWKYLTGGDLRFGEGALGSQAVWYATANPTEMTPYGLSMVTIGGRKLGTKADLKAVFGCDDKLGADKAKTDAYISTLTTGAAGDKTPPATKASDASPQPKAKAANEDAGTAAARAAFDKWVKACTGVYQLEAGDHQCWALWRHYYHDCLRLDPSQWVLQNGSNMAYWASFPANDYMAANFQKLTVSDTWQAGDVFFGGPSFSPWGHVGIVMADDGTTVTCFDQNPHVPSINSYSKSSMVGAIRPKAFGGRPGYYSGDAGSSNPSVGTTLDVNDPANIAKNEAFKLFKFISIGDQMDFLKSAMYSGKLALKNDVPAIDFVRSLCSGTMRKFMSLPDGSFAAFVPDYWGVLKQPGVNNVVEVPAVEVVEFRSRIDKSSYCSHLYMLTSEYAPDTEGMAGMSFVPYSTNSYIRDLQSSGTITLEDHADKLAAFMDVSATGFARAGATDGDALRKLMNSWGVHVATLNDDYITDPTMTTIAALTKFLDMWAACFVTSMSIAFRPEIMPGHRVHFPDAKCTMYVDSVTHSWSATSGGSTVLGLKCPVTDAGKVGIEQR